MAKTELTITVHLEPSEETLQISKLMLELWLNADRRRNILIRERYTDKGQEAYLELVKGTDE